MYRPLLIFLTFLIFTAGKAQTCSISSDSIVCKSELISFSFNASKTASSQKWDFGDGSTATQSSVAHSYSATGKKTVKVDITFTDGTTCTAIKFIMVHDLPTASFAVNSKNQCLFSQNLCITDNSDMGTTTNGYESRLILWGDGNANSSTTPYSNKIVCYPSYPGIGTYKVSVEVKNNKGCEDKWTEDITILEDFKPTFKYFSKTATCDEQEFCFSNDSIKPGNMKKFVWDYGDGTKDSTNWGGVCHPYTSPGIYTVVLTTTLDNGCTNSFIVNVNVTFTKVGLDIKQGDSVLCYPQSFLFSTYSVPGALFYWELLDSNMQMIKIASFHNVPSIAPPYPGEFYVRVRVVLGDCKDTSRYYSLSSVGVKADFIPLNWQQCGLRDTVYFVNETIKHPDARPEYLWSFDDPNAPLCSTSRNNCEYDTLFHSKHWYSDTGCYYPKLYVFDPVSGCRDSIDRLVSLQLYDETIFTHEVNAPCIGYRSEYGVNFEHPLCDGTVEFLADSAEGSWGNFTATHTYHTVEDDSGWITVGFRVELGDSVVYRSADTTDYYIAPDRVCEDTFYKHRWFQLFNEPDNVFEVSQDSCLPVHMELKYIGTDSFSIKRMAVDWEYGWNFTEMNFDTIPDLYHTYLEEGSKPIQVFLIDTNGCYKFFRYTAQLGYFNDFTFDSSICLGQEVQFEDLVRYYGSTANYWADTNTVEKLMWDFGDGNGFSYEGVRPNVNYTTKGQYKITMISNDSIGCTDTVTKTLYVGGVFADAIHDSIYNCNEIIQFFDSSYMALGADGDSIIRYYWDFGDGSIESILKDPYHDYGTNGSITITHAVETEGECVDTIRFTIYLDGPQPVFDIITDSIGCVPLTLKVKSNSVNVSEFIWHFGDDDKTTVTVLNDTTLEFTYDEPGIYHIFLEGADSFYNASTNNYYSCKSVFPDTNIQNPILKRAIVLPYPDVNFTAAQPICVGQPFNVVSTSDSIYTSFKWAVDGEELPEDTSTFKLILQDTGNHMISLHPTYVPQGLYQRACFDSLEKEVFVMMVDADFSIERIENCNEYRFIDSSYNAYYYSWDFGHYGNGDNYSSEVNPEHDYGLDSGEYEVCLYAESLRGCKDTICKTLRGEYYELLQLYNVFTPGNDGYNDEYIIDIFNEDKYSLQIFNRWGELVFETKDPNIHWKGKDKDTGQPLPAGVYFYILKYSYDCSEEEHTVNGSIDMIPER